MNPAAADALLEPTRPVRLRFQVLLALANAGATSTLLPVLTVLIPAQVTRIDPVHSASSLAVVLALGAVGAMIGNPLAGALSDRTTSRWGRRRPWLLVGMVGTTLGLALLSGAESIAVIAAAWTLVQFFGNMLLCSYNAIVPDRVPIRQRGATQAIIGLAVPAAIILSDVLFTRLNDPGAGYYPLIAILVVLTGLFVFLYREAILPKECVPPFRMRAFLASFWVDPRRYPRFGLAWLMWFFMWLGYTLGTGGFFFLYVLHIVQYEVVFPGHATMEGIALLQMLQIIVGVPLMLAAGILSDRVGSQKPFALAGAFLMAAGVAGLIVLRGWTQVVLASVAIGAGFWVFYSLGLAMISRLLPSASNRGKDLGVMNIASTLPQIFMPPVGAAILNMIGITQAAGYQILFGIGAAAMVLTIWILGKGIRS